MLIYFSLSLRLNNIHYYLHHLGIGTEVGKKNTSLN